LNKSKTHNVNIEAIVNDRVDMELQGTFKTSNHPVSAENKPRKSFHNVRPIIQQVCNHGFEQEEKPLKGGWRGGELMTNKLNASNYDKDPVSAYGFPAVMVMVSRGRQRIATSTVVYGALPSCK
jgi:hypothetical protein